MFSGDGVDRDHIRGLAIEVNDHDGFGARGDDGFDRCRVHIARDRIDITKGWDTATGKNRRNRTAPGVRRADYFIPGTKPKSHQTSLNRGGSRAKGERMAATVVAGESLFRIYDTAVRPPKADCFTTF